MLATLVAALAFAQGGAHPTMDFSKETKAQKDARMKWFREARFGMFILGAHAIPAGFGRAITCPARRMAHVFPAKVR